MKAPEDTRILVVEDDEMFQKIMEKRLSNEGNKVRAVPDGREGMKAIVTWDPDLVISDWMMPLVDGLELCRSVKTGLKDAAPYFILLTAREELTDRLLALETGADDYVVKPCDHGELMARIRTGLKIVLLRRELDRARKELGQVIRQREEGQTAAAAASLRICDHCNRIEGEPGTWQSAAEFIEARRLGSVEHAACPMCGEMNRDERRVA